MAWSGFVVRPFARRKVQPAVGEAFEIDFDAVQRELIDPAMKLAQIDGGTTEGIMRAGNIREDMFQMLAHADVVIADITLHNANVFYELGARHALRPKRTYMIRCDGLDVPFDIKTDRYLKYDHLNLSASVAALTQGLRDTLADRDSVDSPIFKLLPALKAPSVAELCPVPQDFQVELRSATERRRIGQLVLLGEEANALPWGAEGLRLVARALFSLKAMEPARNAWEGVRTRLDRDLEADLKLATIYQKLDGSRRDLAASDSAIDRAVANPLITARQQAEALALRGSNAKERWMDNWGGATSAADLGPVALGSEHLQQACDHYAAAFMADLNHDYSGINALAMTRILIDLADAHPEAWDNAFPRSKDAQRRRDELDERLALLPGAVQMSIAGTLQQFTDKDSDDARWARCSEADATLLRVDEKPSRVLGAYRRALESAKPMFFGSVRRQLGMYQRLGLFAPALAQLWPELDRLENATPGAAGAAAYGAASGSAATTTSACRVMLFAGHRLDEPGRAAPRFPAAQEGVARQGLRDAVAVWQAQWPGEQLLGLAGGASGGDILFHEVCAELGVATELFLVMGAEPYIQQSVRVAPEIDGVPGWIERFNALRRRCEASGRLRQLGESAELPGWLARLKDYSIWERNNRWMLLSALAGGADHVTLLVLWDGQAGDGPGGTQHMVNVASDAGATVRRIDTRRLFNLT